MDEIQVKELNWGWYIDIPCTKCGRRECLGTYLTTVTNANERRFIILNESAYNKKEAIDNSMCMAKMWSMYCNQPPNYSPEEKV